MSNRLKLYLPEIFYFLFFHVFFHVFFHLSFSFSFIYFVWRGICGGPAVGGVFRLAGLPGWTAWLAGWTASV